MKSCSYAIPPHRQFRTGPEPGPGVPVPAGGFRFVKLSGMRKDYIDAVLQLTGLIPPGRVLAYGDVAEMINDGGPRQVGSVMSHYGDQVPWWRVLRASGHPAEGHGERALAHYRAEATPLRGKTTGEDASWRVDIQRARWQPDEQGWQEIDRIADSLAPREKKMSEPDDLMES